MVNYIDFSNLFFRIFISALVCLAFHLLIGVESILSFLIFFPLLGCFLIILIPAEKKNTYKDYWVTNLRGCFPVFFTFMGKL